MKGHNWGPEPCKKCGKTHRTAPVKSHTPWNKGLKNDQRVSKLTKNLGSYAQRGGSSNEQNAMFGKTGSEHPAFGYKHTSKGTKKISASLRQRVHDEFVAGCRANNGSIVKQPISSGKRARQVCKMPRNQLELRR
jgi:hypothetical protein